MNQNLHYILCLFLGGTLAALGCEPGSEQAETSWDSMEAALEIEDGTWGMTPSGATIFVEASRLCEATRIPLSPGDQVVANEFGDGFVVMKADTGVTETLICDCTDGADTSCTPLWQSDQGMVCAMGRGCNACKKIVKKKKGNNIGTSQSTESAPVKNTPTKKAGEKVTAEETKADNDLEVSMLYRDSIGMGIYALEAASSTSASEENTCLAGPEADEQFEEARRDLFAAVYGDAGMDDALAGWHPPITEELDFVQVWIHGRPLVMAVPLAMITDKMTKAKKPKSCTCLPKETPQPVDADGDLITVDSDMSLNTGTKAGTPCKLKSTFGYYTCKRYKTCKTSCAMEF